MNVSQADLSLSQVRAAARPSAAPRTPPALFEALVEQVRTHPESLQRAKAELPEAMREIDYDAYRSIRFRPERSLWRGEPGQFEAQFFHPGFYFRDLIDVYVVEAGTPYPFPFSPQLFNYGELPHPATGAGLGFTGLRLHAPINRSSYRDEVIVFQGASYFRSLGRGQVYGLSARALALDMGSPSGEEFPAFVDFYLVRPAADDESVWVLATLSSRRARGVYAFHVTPGDSTTIDVFARVWLDDRTMTVGLAPLSSMFLFGEEAPASFGDFRPEVHDSDGMAFHAGNGEWLYRPLRNPRSTGVSVFRLDSPRGFGLLQRDRDPSSYEDLEAHYQDRPSVWIEPRGDWGAGALHLLEIASTEEINDNVALAWVPDHVPEDGLALQYRMTFGPGVPGRGPGGSATATRRGRTENGERFVVDFRGPDIDPKAEVDAALDVRGARVMEQHVIPDPRGGRIRLSFEAVPEEGAHDIELRAYLRSQQAVVSETWSYRWQPNR